MTIWEVSEKINQLAYKYKMGNFQNIRKELKNFKRVTSKNIFSKRSIKDDKHIYAFHSGGRKEIQYNIGYEEEYDLFRYGLAFSLKTSKFLRDISFFKPKINKYNTFLYNTPLFFSNLRQWYYEKDTKGYFGKPKQIEEQLIKKGTFIFIGKYFDKKMSELNNSDFKEILTTFDKLLDLYIYVEKNSDTVVDLLPNSNNKFIFKPGHRKSIEHTKASHTQGETEIDLYHNKIQTNIFNQLAQKYGRNNVGTELPSGTGTNIDLVVVKDKDNIVFYEIKTHESIRICIREALSQLLEYAYWSDGKNAQKLIIVSKNEITGAAKNYLNKLRKDFQIPVFYQRYNPNTDILEEYES